MFPNKKPALSGCICVLKKSKSKKYSTTLDVVGAVVTNVDKLPTLRDFIFTLITQSGAK